MTYKNIEIKQAENNHVMILKNGKMVMHMQVDHQLNDEEKRKAIDFYCFIGELEEIGE